MTISLLARLTACAVALVVCTESASALTIKEFRKYSREQQAVFVSGAMSMAAYTYASNGDTAKARCIQDWYFATIDVDTPGPDALALEIAVAEKVDAEKLHVEGVILGLTDKVCGVEAGGK